MFLTQGIQGFSLFQGPMIHPNNDIFMVFSIGIDPDWSTAIIQKNKRTGCVKTNS
ncbi:MAG: Uncharacterised protein [Opitutia bacterium UBA7350]|nr:MAG: Uncharacterised protein [Opitutae bacterium UBA7350]